jgi:DNA invertase Pin-like site-specific DNA recombinase
MLKLAAYCRVSVDFENALNSLENQKRYFEDFIKENEEWAFVALHYDEGISGTSLKKRERFNEMVRDACKGYIDLILVKDISRFARNTVDALETVRLLKANNVDIWFVNDGIDTREIEWELRFTIYAGFAQEESRRISERIQFGVKRNFEKGIPIGKTPYGYKRKNDKIEIIESEAEIVRKIFDLYLSGLGCSGIAAHLNTEGIRFKTGELWRVSTIRRILYNETYIGNISRKSELKNLLQHTRKNLPLEKRTTIENVVSAILDKKIWELCNAEKEKRREKFKNSGISHNAWARGKVYCENCGKICTAYFYGKDKKYASWRCVHKNIGGDMGCKGYCVKNIVIEFCIVYLLNVFASEFRTLFQTIISELSNIEDKSGSLLQYQREQKIYKLKQQREFLFVNLMDGDITNEDFTREKNNIDNEIKLLSEYVPEKNISVIEDIWGCLVAIEEYVEKLVFNDNILKSICEKVVINEKGVITIHIKGVNQGFKFKYTSDCYKGEERVICELIETN